MSKLCLCIAGSRDIGERLAVSLIEHYAAPVLPYLAVIYTGDARGVDQAAMVWARRNHIPYHSFTADWKRYPKEGGVIRNTRMVDSFRDLNGEKQGLVIRYPVSKGSQHTQSLLVQHGIPVWDVCIPIPFGYVQR